MLRTHCDVCDKIVGDRLDHVWANDLAEKDPLREISAKIQFFSSKKEIDLCSDCRIKWFRGIAGIFAEVIKDTRKLTGWTDDSSPDER